MAAMSSPVTTFLYVLMRDHLPTGTVKYLIDQAQRAGEPVYSAPELEALAQRYADELLNAAPREDTDDGQDEELPTAPPAMPVGRGEDATGVSGAGVKAIEPDSPPATDTVGPDEADSSALGKSPATLSPHLSYLLTDVELMAQISDYIEHAGSTGESCWPTELDEHFGMSPQRRRTIIEMLVERNRVIVRKPNSPHLHYDWRKMQTTDYSAARDLDDDGTTGTLHLRDKPEIRHDTRGRVKLDDQLIGDFKKWAIGQRTFKRRVVIQAFSVSASTAGRMCNRLVQEGVLELRGERGGAHYVVTDAHLAVPVPKVKPNGKVTSDNGDGTAEGRVMMALSGGRGQTAGEIARAARMTREELRPIIEKLREESMCHAVVDGEETRFSLV